MQTHAQKHMAQYPARPKATAEILLKAGQAIEEELSQHINWKGRCKGLATALAKISGAQHMNGYKLAKHLESDDSLYNIDMDAVEILDNFGAEVDELVQEQETQWAHDNNVQPPHPIGTVLTIGTITGIYEYSPALYKVDEGKGENCLLLIKYENAITPAEYTATQAAH